VYDHTVVETSPKQVKPSGAGELEITDLNRQYLDEAFCGSIDGSRHGWLDYGHPGFAHMRPPGYIRTVGAPARAQVGCPEEVAWRLGWIEYDPAFETFWPNHSRKSGSQLSNYALSDGMDSRAS